MRIACIYLFGHEIGGSCIDLVGPQYILAKFPQVVTMRDNTRKLSFSDQEISPLPPTMSSMEELQKILAKDKVTSQTGEDCLKVIDVKLHARK